MGYRAGRDDAAYDHVEKLAAGQRRTVVSKPTLSTSPYNKLRSETVYSDGPPTRVHTYTQRVHT